jgi:hypothetical protein
VAQRVDGLCGLGYMVVRQLVHPGMVDYFAPENAWRVKDTDDRDAERNPFWSH